MSGRILLLVLSLGLVVGAVRVAHADPAPAPLTQVTPQGPAEIPAACVNPPPKSAPPSTPPLYERFAPIALLLLVIGFVVRRLPKVDVGHSAAFRTRRLLNWLPLGLTYSFLYFARYNLNQFMYVHGITEREFGDIFAWGSLTYGLAFIVNGPLTDLWGGRVTILIAAGGAAVCNAAMGYMVLTGNDFGDRVGALTLLYCGNMYFQSFGAVSIVKVNASWFHLRERGTFGGIFGILISLGLFFAFDGGKFITDSLPHNIEWLFFVPSILLGIFFVLSLLFVRDTPAQAGLTDFEPGDATSLYTGDWLAVLRKVISNPIIWTIAAIEMCSGFLRQSIMEWGRNFGSAVGLGDTFVIQNWGVVTCIAGILGGVFAGTISDHLFQSRRLPVSAVLYLLMLAGAIAIVPLFAAPGAIPWVIAIMSMAIIGVHGMLSGTASADFGGMKNAGIAVGIIDGFVYLGSSVQSWIYGRALPAAKVTCPDGKLVANPAAKVIENWHVWPYAMIPAALIGLTLAIVLWNARPQPKKR